MSSCSDLETSEDLENVQLVRMEDVQPPRDRNCDVYNNNIQDEVLGTCVVDDVNYAGDCVVNDDDFSNIGSMVSIQSEVVTVRDCNVKNNTVELLVPDSLDISMKGNAVYVIQNSLLPKLKTHSPESWPTLEILPGGVIKNMDKSERKLSTLYPNIVDPATVVNSGDMMYACAKCSQSFKYLFCLVKHVKWHESVKKKEKAPHLMKTKPLHDHKYVRLHTGKRKLTTKSNIRKYKKP